MCDLIMAVCGAVWAWRRSEQAGHLQTPPWSRYQQIGPAARCLQQGDREEQARRESLRGSLGSAWSQMGACLESRGDRDVRGGSCHRL